MAFFILLLSNLTIVPLKLFGFETNVPLMFVIGLSAIIGIFIGYLFVSLNSREKKLKEKIKLSLRSKIRLKNSSKNKFAKPESLKS